MAAVNKVTQDFVWQKKHTKPAEMNLKRKHREGEADKNK